MDHIFAFIQEQKTSYLATVENGTQARVRPMNGLIQIDGQLTWCTNNQKDMFKQVLAYPHVEVCMFGAGKTVRISGRCVPAKDEKMKEKFLALQPKVAQFYGGNEDTLEILVFETATAIIVTGGNKEIIKLY